MHKDLTREERSIFMSTPQHIGKNGNLSDILSRRGAHLHFAGILGVSMSSLAEVLYRRGYRITGSDTGEGSTRDRLEALGIPISRGNSDEYMAGCDALIYSLAIPDSFYERKYADKFGIPEFSRAELLGNMMASYKHRIGVSGTHGKSTTTAMLHRIFTDAGKCPTTLCGAPLDTGDTFAIGGDGYFIYEACEYRDAFLNFTPETALITGIELDHTDYYSNIDGICTSFLKSTNGATRVILNTDYHACATLIDNISCRKLSYGKEHGAENRYEVLSEGKDGTSFMLYAVGHSPMKFFIPLIGEYNVANATAATLVALEYGIPYEAVLDALKSFHGIPRRLEYICSAHGRKVYYDYAHHPTEIRKTLEAVKRIHGKCTVIFRPHTYTRTRDLWGGFVSALRLADRSVITDIFPAREKPLDGVTSERLAFDVGQRSCYLKMDDVTDYTIRDTDGVIVLMGAGDLERIKEEFKNIGE